MMGIYKITNKINNKAYIGQSIDIEHRWKTHISRHSTCSAIHKAIEKYGTDNFIFEVLEECKQKELNDKEIYWIKYYNTFEDGYNLTRGGDCGFFYDIDAVYEDYLKTNNIAKTAKNIGSSIGTARRILRLFDINGNELQEDKAIE